MFNATTVVTNQPYSREAGLRLGRDLVSRLGRNPDACWLFCAPGAGMEELVGGVYETVKTPNLVGCTTDGEISTSGFTVSSAVLAGIVTDRVRFRAASVTGLRTDSERAGRELAKKLPADARHVQLLSDGLTGNGCALVRGMNLSLGPRVVVSGGTAGDARMFKQTWQFEGNRVLTDSAVAIAMSGDFEVGTGVRSGWFPAGATKKVTRSRGNVVYELDGEPALSVYRGYLGPLAKRLPAVGVQFPFGLVDEMFRLGEDPILRAPMAISESDGSVTFAGEIPEGSTVCLTTGGTEEKLLDASREAARRAVQALKGIKPQMIFFYSCMARKILLGSRTGAEIENIRNTVGGNLPAIGFYTYGEFCPNVSGAECHLHNETATVTVLGLPY